MTAGADIADQRAVGAPTGDRTYDKAALAALKFAAGLAVSVCVPARDEAATVTAIVAPIVADLIHRVGLVDEIVVLDDGSIDATGALAAAAGAVVVRHSVAAGKGGAMARAAREARGDIIVFLDADVSNFDCHFVVDLLGPLLIDPDVMLVKADYRRPYHGRADQGGRVTELLARPLLERFFPALSLVAQPLAGEYAVRRHALDRITLDAGYGVDVGILLDVAHLFGPAAIAQVDLGERVHRNRPLDQLASQAREVLAAILARNDVGRLPRSEPIPAAGPTAWPPLRPDAHERPKSTTAAIPATLAAP